MNAKPFPAPSASADRDRPVDGVASDRLRQAVSDETVHQYVETSCERLRNAVGDEAMRRYVESYLRLLPERLDSAESAAAAGQRSRAAPLLADLRTGSGMIGAEKLAALAGTAEAALRGRGPVGGAEVDWAQLRTQAETVERALRHTLDDLDGDYEPGAGPPNR
jgi:HPt (histidine-containing phosphotransfer) domain-containing protein